MESTIEFRILGPLEVWREGGSLPLGGLKQRSLLALLLLQANQVVSTDRLVHELWGDEPPGTAVTALHGYVSQLRKLIEPERTAGGESRVLVTRPPGYVLNVGPGQLDLDRFEASVRHAREELVAGRPEPAARDLREAFALWRGAPLADLASEPFAQSAARPLEELWLAALEDRIDADLALGRHREVASELEAVIRSHPLRERLRGQQMLALYRCGRQADALNAYADARRTLSEELGIEPSSALKQLERDILNQEGSLGAPVREPEQQAEAEAAPRRRRRRGVVLAGATAAVIAVAAGVVLSTRPAPTAARRCRRTPSGVSQRTALSRALRRSARTRRPSPSARAPCGRSTPVTARSRASIPTPTGRGRSRRAWRSATSRRAGMRCG